MGTQDDHIRELQAAVETLQRQVRDLQQPRSAPVAPASGRMSRRGILQAAGTAAAGMAAASLFDSGTTPALAANGGNLVLGMDNTATSITSLTGSVLAGPALQVSNYNGAAVDAYSDALQSYTYGAGFAAIYGRNDAPGGNGIIGFSANGVAASFNGGLAPLQLVPGATAGIPATTGHQLGEIYVDSNGAFFIYTGVSPAWQQIGTTNLGLQPFPNPRRVFHQNMLSGQSALAIDATTKLAGGPSGVPAGARAMYAAVQSDQPGRLTLFPNGTTDPGIANWTNNGTPGSLFLAYMLVPLDPTGRFSLHSYIAGNVYVDAWGSLM